MSCEARLTELEGEAAALRRQVSDLREILNVELERMRAEIQAQLNEAKQILLDRESESMRRVAQLEAEVAKLTRICEQAVRKEELLGRLSLDHEIIDQHTADESKAPADRSREMSQQRCEGSSEFPHEKVLSIQMSTAAELTEKPDTKSISSVVSDLKSRLDAVFEFYTAASAANAALLHPTMHLSHFTVMVRDAGLCSGRHPVPPELLWMAVVRSVPPASARAVPSRRTGTTLLHTRVYGDKSDAGGHARHKDVFARERLQYISREQFSEALYAVYCTTHSHSPTGEAPPTARDFRQFLVETFLPAVEQRIRRREVKTSAFEFVKASTRDHSTSSPMPEAPVAFAASSATAGGGSSPAFAGAVVVYEADENCQKLVRQFSSHLKQAFMTAVRCPAHLRLSEARMNLEAFIECVRHHQLLPLVSRAAIKEIFLFCLTAPSKARSVGAPDECISYPSFVLAMYCLAEQLYGNDLLLQQQYPSAQARLSKLLVKMFVL